MAKRKMTKHHPQETSKAASPENEQERRAKLERRQEQNARRELLPRDPQAFAINSLQQGINRLFDSFLRGFGSPGLELWDQTLRAYTPRVDVREKDKEIEINAQLPGIDEKDLQVSVGAQNVTISGEKRGEDESQEEGFYRMEHSYGAFYRQIPLPAEIDANRAEASFENGALKLRLPKLQQNQQNAKQVPIQHHTEKQQEAKESHREK